VKCYERKTIGILGRVEREGSDNENAAASVASGVVIQPKSLVGPDRPRGNMEDCNTMVIEMSICCSRNGQNVSDRLDDCLINPPFESMD
jgi:hypothetical protein